MIDPRYRFRGRLVRHLGSGPFFRCLVLAMPLIWIGCAPPVDSVVQRNPRPVLVEVLKRQPPPNSALVTASAGSWKTEDLGFEVGGRVEFVAEQNTEINGRIPDADGNLIIEGTPIARIESERYELSVASAKAAVVRSEQDLKVAQTELEETIPAQLAAATSSAELAKLEFERSRELKARNAGSQSELDAARSRYENAIAELRQVSAAEKSQKNQIESLGNAILQAKQSLRDAERDLEDCTLYSSFRGLVSSTAVVPGSLVSAGTPVVTLQMMDPIKVELEVSGEQARELQRTEMLPVYVTMPDGQTQVLQGFLHQIDPSADPLTRTFTLTILVLNQQLTNGDNQKSATTRDIWRLDLKFIPGAKEGDLFVEENSILTDDEGQYVWQVTNLTIQERSSDDHMFEVRKLRVKPDEFKVPYLGDYIFQRVVIEDEAFGAGRNLIVGELNVADENPNEWDGTQVLLDSPSRWMLRPGDLVEVDLSARAAPDGYYIPMDAICRKGDESFIFVIESGVEPATVKQVPVEIADQVGGTTSSLRRVEFVDDTSMDGKQYVTKGTHYLVDGEQVTLVSDADSDTGAAQ